MSVVDRNECNLKSWSMQAGFTALIMDFKVTSNQIMKASIRTSRISPVASSSAVTIPSLVYLDDVLNGSDLVRSKASVFGMQCGRDLGKLLCLRSQLLAR